MSFMSFALAWGRGRVAPACSGLLSLFFCVLVGASAARADESASSEREAMPPGEGYATPFERADETSATTPSGSSKALVAPAPGLVNVSLQPARPGDRVLFFVESGADGRPAPWRSGHGARGEGLRFEPLCVAPCVARLPAGTFKLALSSEHADPVPVEKAVILAKDTTVRGQLQRRSWRAAAGTLVVLGSIIATLAILADSARPYDSGGSDGYGQKYHVPIAMLVFFNGVPLGACLIATSSPAARLTQE
jgi:hypothetical protein